MTDEARAVPVEGDRERLADIIDQAEQDWLGAPHEPVDTRSLGEFAADALLRADVSLTGSGLREALRWFLDNNPNAEAADLIDGVRLLLDDAALSGESDASLRDAFTPCPKGCREKETGDPHPAHVGRCGLPTGHLGVVSCYCTVSA